jgi:hypothetical protein
MDERAASDDLARRGRREPCLGEVLAQLGAAQFRRLVHPEAAQHHLFGGRERLRGQGSLGFAQDAGRQIPERGVSATAS